MKQQTISLLMALAVIVGCWKGYIALFEPGATEPKQIFPTLVESLPLADQEALAQGILIRNDKSLYQLLEDYLS